MTSEARLSQFTLPPDALTLIERVEGKYLGVSLETTFEYSEASSDFTALSDRLKRAETEYRDIKDPLNKAIRALDAKMRAIKDQITAARSIVGACMMRFEDEQKRIADVARKKLEAEARKQAEKEREAAARELERDAKKADTRADSRDLKKAAREVRSAPVVEQRMTVQPDIPKSRTQTRTTWDAQIFDLARHVKAMAEGVVMIEAVIGIEERTGGGFTCPFLNQQARSMAVKGSTTENRMNKRRGGQMPFPGVRAISQTKKTSGR